MNEIIIGQNTVAEIKINDNYTLQDALKLAKETTGHAIVFPILGTNNVSINVIKDMGISL